MITRSVAKALAQLRISNVVAIPTETVYGLAASIDSLKALRKIFKIKKRPFFDPLIVHVNGIPAAKKLTPDWSIISQKLAETFWPGPLTLVLKKNSRVNELITSGLPTVGIRCPQHVMTLKLLEMIDVPLAAPSANLFGKTSPTRAQHVEQEFRSKNLLVLDGGACKIGIESTILKVEKKKNIWLLEILRPGMLGADEIDKALIKLKKLYQWKKQKISKKKPLLPQAAGMLEHHYQPSIPLFYVRALTQYKVPKANENKIDLVLSTKPSLAARQLYHSMRTCAESGAKKIYFFEPKYFSKSEWAPIKERLQKASTKIIG